jgi:hypothetical protein
MATLAQLAQAYLNQGLPSISGIFQPRADTPVEEPVEETTSGITPLLLQQTGGGGGGFNPYNINPNDPNIRTSDQYRPDYEYRRFSEPDKSMIEMGRNQEFFYGKPPTGLEQLANKAINFVPYIGPIKRGVEFLTGAIGDVMPINKRAILENELLGGGIMLDNIGRIVTNDYNTPTGIMAGYNAAQLTNKSFDKRTSNISKALREKGLSQTQIDKVISEIEETGEYTGDITDESLGVNNLFSNLVNVSKSQNLFNKRKKTADVIFDKKIEERQNKARIARETKQKAEAARKNQTYTGGSDKQNIVDRNTGRRDATGGDAGSKGASDQFSNKSGRGRTGY